MNGACQSRRPTMADDNPRRVVLHTTTESKPAPQRPRMVPEDWVFNFQRRLWQSPDGVEWISEEQADRLRPEVRIPRPGTSVRLVLEVSPLDLEDELDPVEVHHHIARLVRELEQVRKQDGDVTLTVNGFGMDFWLRDVRAERVTQ